DPTTGDDLDRVRFLTPPPLRLSLLIGDGIHNLRSALDHLAWQLVVANHSTPNSETGFPISDLPKNFKSLLHQRLGAASSQAKAVCEGLQPYRGGKDALWRLHRLDIADKHRLLIPVALAHTKSTYEFSQPWLEFGRTQRVETGARASTFPVKHGD